MLASVSPRSFGGAAASQVLERSTGMSLSDCGGRSPLVRLQWSAHKVLPSTSHLSVSANSPCIKCSISLALPGLVGRHVGRESALAIDWIPRCLLGAIH